MKTSNDPRHLARKVAFAVLFTLTCNEQNLNELGSDEIDQNIKTAADTYAITRYDQVVLSNILDSAIKNKETIKNLISTNTKDWEVTKIYKTDYALIYMATSELLTNITPKKVIIDETVELAKEFGIEESPKFINGVLAGIVNSLDKQ